jgi:hypothetical protein
MRIRSPKRMAPSPIAELNLRARAGVPAMRQDRRSSTLVEVKNRRRHYHNGPTIPVR